MSTVRIGDRDITLERFTMVKAMRVITLLGLIQKSVPEVMKEVVAFKREYRANNVIELDRVQAKLRFGDPTPVLGEDGEPLYRDGQLVTIPSAIDRMTEGDWERAGHVVKLNQSPSNNELVMAVFPTAYEHAEETVQRLLGLVAMPNAKVSEYARAGNLWEKVDEFVEDVIAPAYLDEIMELAVAAGETIEGQVMTKAKGLGDRVGNLLRLLGLKTTETDSTQSTSETSSEQPVQPNTISVSRSDDSSPSPIQTESSDGLGTESSPSETSLTPSVS